MKLLMSSHKIFLLFLFIINTVNAEDIYKVELILIKFNDVVTDEKFKKNLSFKPDNIRELKEKEILIIPEKFIDNSLSSTSLLDLDTNEIQIRKNDDTNDHLTNEIFDFYEYEDLESLDFLMGRLRWRDNIEILDSISWYQPLKNQNEYTFHYDKENNISLFINLYQSRYLHLDLKSFRGKLESNNEIKEFIDEGRKIKDLEINYFDHPSMGVIIRVNKI